MSSYRSHKEKTLLEQVERALTPEEESALFTPAGYDFREAEKGGYSNYSYWQSTFRAFFKNRVAVFLLLVMAALLLFTVVQPYLPGQRDPNLIYDNPLNGLPLRNQQPNGEFWFGTNSIGQDLWARIWAGTRTSLFIGFVVAGVEALLGILAGMLWGYVRRVEFLFTELYNILDNLPQTLVLVLFSLILKPSIQTMVLAMCMTGWIQMTTIWPPVAWAPPPGASSSKICCPIWSASSCCGWLWPSPPPSATRSLSPTSAWASPWKSPPWATSSTRAGSS